MQMIFPLGFQAFLLACILGSAAAFYPQCDAEDVDLPQPRGRTLIQNEKKNEPSGRTTRQANSGQVDENEDEEEPAPKKGRALIQGTAANGETGLLSEEDLVPANIREPAFLQDLLKMKLTPEVKAVMGTVKNMVQPLFGIIQDASSNDTQLRDGLHAQFSSMNATLQTTLSDTGARENATAAARLNHTRCRTEEATVASEVTTCTNAVAAAKNTLDHSLLALFGAHNSEAGTFLAKTMDTFAADMTDPVLSDLLTKTEIYIDANLAYAPAAESEKKQDEACTNTTTVHTEKKTECDKEQKKLEGVACDYQMHINTTCAAYKDDYNRLFSNYGAVSADVQIRAADRKVEWTHLTKVDCVATQMSVLAGDGSVAASLSPIMACYNQTVDTDHLTIPERQAPTVSGCPALPPAVCSADFVQQEYDSLPEGAQATTCSTTCGA